MCPCASIADHRSGAQSSQKRLSRIALIFDTALSEDMNGHCRGLAEAPRHSDIESLASHFGERVTRCSEAARASSWRSFLLARPNLDGQQHTEQSLGRSPPLAGESRFLQLPGASIQRIDRAAGDILELYQQEVCGDDAISAAAKSG